jgi:nitrogen-specific signal transduction histidine kinase
MNENLEASVAERTRQLAVATQMARSASQAKSTFLANMSHEIRTPMTAILGLAELMKLDSPSPRQAERLDKLHSAAQHLLSLIDDILDFSKIEAGKLVLEEVPCDVARIVAGVVDMSTDRARQKGLTLSSDCETLPSPLLGDPTRLRQALLNYVCNAIRFTPQGSIRISVRRQEESKAPLPGKDSLMLRFEVRDTGIGIAASSLGRLFRHFEQADDSMTRVYGGTGLGLAIVKQIAERMGGSVGVDSIEGAGSTFWFTACLQKVPERAGGDTATATAGVDTAAQQAPPQGRILIVDDEPINREVIVAILESMEPARRLRSQWRDSGRAGRQGVLRSDPDGPADADHGRIRGDAPDSPTAEARAGADPGPHRQRHQGSPGSLPGRRNERLHRQTLPNGGAARGRHALAATAARRMRNEDLQSAAVPAGDSSLAASACHRLRGHRIARVLP